MSAIPEVQPAARARPAPIKLDCMEIWGGNGEHDSAISVPGVDAWVYSRPQPGSQSGGDIHYVSKCGAGHIIRFAVADVSGHGEKVAGVASLLRSLMRRYINTLNQAKFARALNREFARRSADGIFATAILATYFTVRDQLVLVNAGHPAPLWYQAERRTWQVLCPDMPECSKRVFNLPLGIISPTQYQQFAVPLGQDDLVLIFTDSLVEAKSPDGRLLTQEGLLDLVRRLDPGDPLVFRDALLRAVSAFRGDAPPEDDLTLLMIRHNGADPPWPGLGETLRNVGKMMRLIKV